MNKPYNFVKKYKKSFIFGLLALLAVLFFVLGGGDKKQATYTVTRANIEDSIELSGKIQSEDQAELGFAASGRIARIPVKNNQKVVEGQVLAQLEIGDLLADLRIKELNSKTSDVDLASAKAELENIKDEQDAKVNSAYRKLLSDDLMLIPDSSSYPALTPTVSGAYTGSLGDYKIRILKDQSADSGLKLLTFDLENTSTKINDTGPTSLGTKGLYVSFPSSFSSYNDTVWHLEIPNKSGASYTSNLNAYIEAKHARDLAVKNAEDEYNRLLTSDSGGNSVAQAEISKINAEIRKNTIYAPFGGIVTNIEREVGENASIGDRVISILGEKKLEVVLQVSELDVARLTPNTKIQISLDAIPNETFEGTLKTVNSRETEVEGVPVYEAFVELGLDPRIKAGMNAKGIIVLSHKEDVLAIPNYVVTKENGKSYVEVMLPSGKTEKREVTLGLVGSNSNAEVLRGLSEGEVVISNRDEK